MNAVSEAPCNRDVAQGIMVGDIFGDLDIGLDLMPTCLASHVGVSCAGHSL